MKTTISPSHLPPRHAVDKIDGSEPTGDDKVTRFAFYVMMGSLLAALLYFLSLLVII